MKTKSLSNNLGVTTQALSLALSLTLSLTVCAGAGAPPKGLSDYSLEYSPYTDKPYAQQPLWGDTHLHTTISGDAIAFGTILTHADAYQLALGKEVVTSHGIKSKLSRPLDFLVVADHAEGYGLVRELRAGNPKLLADKDQRIQRWYKMLNAGEFQSALVGGELVYGQATGNLPQSVLEATDLINDVWQESVKTATRYNNPGTFTAFHGFEWSSLIQGNNLHRVVIFADGEDKVSQTQPLDSNSSGQDPEQLWAWMQRYEDSSGGQVLAIPHNSNLSNGIMFQTRRNNGEPITAAYANNRMRWEPLTEITQIKGDSETHAQLSPNDEFADFETWDKGNLGGVQATTADMFDGSYVRAALKNGLLIDQAVGANPFRFGVIGSTDSHTGIPSAEENNFYGKNAFKEPSPDRWKLPKKKPKQKTRTKQGGWEFSASGMAAVWAKENTRQSIFDAMKRKETYGTSGPRMSLRMFAGWEFSAADAKQRDIAEVGYQKGVPMGGDISAGPKNTAPGFLIAGRMDPIGATLDRLQVVKGWVDSSGKAQEKVYDIAWAGDRRLNKAGKLPAIESTVDVEQATWSNEQGAAELISFWQDPDFVAEQRAFYYARLLEVPTPRWTAYDQKRFAIKMDEEVPMVIQERAYGSPIWYLP